MTAQPSASPDLLVKIKQYVREVDPDAEVILFGSRARGDARADSDWDVLILLPTDNIHKQKKIEIRDHLYELELEQNIVISAIIHTKDDWEKRAVTPIYQIINREGRAA